MGRRKSDRLQFWLLAGAFVLSGAMSLVASFVSWRAVSTIEALNDEVKEARNARLLREFQRIQ